MEFKRLKSSIELNANESPSIYMALCMIESLFKDIKDETGLDIYHTPIGDETLPTKMVWLCRVLNKIYSENSEELVRNRKRLDEMMGQLAATEQEVASFTEESEKLAALTRQWQELQEQLAAARSHKEEFELLTQQCTQAEREIEQLRQFDPDAVRSRMTELNKQIQQLEQSKAALLRQLDALSKKREGLESENLQLTNNYEAARAQEAELQKANASIQASLSDLEAETKNLRLNVEDLKTQRDDLIREHAVLQKKTDELQNRIDCYQQENIVPLEASIAQLTAQMKDLAGKMQQLQEERIKLEGKRDTHIYQIAILGQEAAELQKEVNEKREALESVEARVVAEKKRRDSLVAERQKLTAELDSLNDESTRLQTVQIPDLKELIKKGRDQHQELVARIEELQEKQHNLETDIQTLTDQISGSEKKLAVLESTRMDLMASYAAKNEEIGALEKQLAELRGKTDRQKVKKYREQLEAELAALEEVQRECALLEAEIEQEKQVLEAQNKRTQDLKNQKQQLETAQQEIKALLTELAPVASEEYINQVESACSQLALLTSVRAKLVESVKLMQNALGYIPVEDSITLEDQMSDEIRDLQAYLFKLRESLLRCADSLKLEETK